jgi:thymidylate kinase
MIINDEEELLDYIANEDPRIIVFEGARCSGKSRLIDIVSKDLWYFDVYECAKPRKQWMDSTGSVTKLPKYLDLSQSTFWVFDLLNQIDALCVIFNRSVPSNAYYDREYAGEKLEAYDTWMNKLGGVTVYVDNPMQDYITFLDSAGRIDELADGTAEKAGIKENILRLNQHPVITYINKL